MGFPFLPKSVTLNDLERRNGRLDCVILPNSVTFGLYYVKVVEDTPIHFASEMSVSYTHLTLPTNREV